MGDLMSRNEKPDFSSSDESNSVENSEMLQLSSVSSGQLSMNSDANLTMDTDAVNSLSVPAKRLDLNKIVLPSIKEIENDLDQYEKISLIFLLSANVQDCLDVISLYDWAGKNIKLDKNWQGKLVEAITVIKNFHVLKKFGFKKDDLVKEYFPFTYFATKYISKFRKIIYSLCEKLTEGMERTFLQKIEEDFERKGLAFIKFPQSEMYFSYFLRIGYITETNVTNCATILKIMGLEDICDMLKIVHVEEVQRKVDRHFSADDSNSKFDERISRTISSGDISLADSTTSGLTHDNAQNLDHELKTAADHPMVKKIQKEYDMSGNRICLIIDQENFYTETNEEYKDLLPKNVHNEKLHTRSGTSIDSKKLEETLKKRKFEITTKRNQTHLNMISVLQNFVQEIDERNCSCFFVCILSHGEEGVVYGCNSCYVEISRIIEIMCHKKLDNIPKVLILQSCQGPTLQMELKKNSNIETDGPSIKSRSHQETKDFLIFWSTVPGYSSIRNKITGTWFIQSLCKQLDETGDTEHFKDICTNIIDEVTSKKWEKDKHTDCYMVPMEQSTFTKKLYLKI